MNSCTCGVHPLPPPMWAYWARPVGGRECGLMGAGPARGSGCGRLAGQPGVHIIATGRSGVPVAWPLYI